MKSSKIFWGVFLVSLGTLLLIRQFGVWDVDLGDLFNLWPSLLIIWGVSLLKIGEIAKLSLIAITALLLAVFTAGFFSEVKYHKHIDINHIESGLDDSNFDAELL
jgi:hypothetical protein